jgi:hypothetical protein
MTSFTRCFAVLVLCAFVGCSDVTSPEEVMDSDEMLNVLTSALSAWKDGAADTLAQRDPPIRFVDDDFAEGRQLIAYDLEDPEAVIEPFQNVFVTLSLKAADGKTLERTVGYQVSLEPSPSVLRSEP